MGGNKEGGEEWGVRKKRREGGQPGEQSQHPPQHIGPLTTPIPLSYTSLTPPRSPLPYTEAPCVSLAKTEPPLLGFRFLAQNPLPLACHWITQPQDPNPALPHFSQPPTVQIQAFLHVIPENRASTTRFSIFSPKPPPPCVPLDRTDPGPKPRLTLPQSTPHYPNPSFPTCHLQKSKPRCSVFGFLAPNPLLLMHHWITQTQDPNPDFTPPPVGPLYPKMNSPPLCVHRNWAPAARISDSATTTSSPARRSIAHPTTSNPLYPTPSWSTSSKNKPPAMHSPKLSPSGSVSFLFVCLFFFWFFGEIFFVLHILLIVAIVEQYCGHLLYDFISMIISFLCFSLT